MVTEKKIYYVPWADVSEWNTVREQIFSSNTNDTVRAYETILMWKLKYPNIPAYIECTYSLLQVMVKEFEMMGNENTSPSLFRESDLQLSYSTALIRFVNHVSSISSHKGKTLYLAAKTQNIPDWIINMRHDAAHGQDLPTLDALHVAAELSLKWLLDNYWVHKDDSVEQNLNFSELYIDSFSEVDINAQIVFKKVFDVWEICHSSNHQKISFLSEVNLEFILHIEELLNLTDMYFPDLIVCEDAEYFKRIINSYTRMEKEDFNFVSSISMKSFRMTFLHFVKSLAKSNPYVKNSLVISLLETSFLSEVNFKSSKWASVICLLQELGLFPLLLQILFQMAGNGNMGASKWLQVLYPSIKLLKRQWAAFTVLRKENKNYRTKLLKKNARMACKAKNCDVTIKLGIFKPPVITLDMMSGVLLNPENFSVKIITDYLKMIKPPLTEPTIELLKDLLSLQTNCINEVGNGSVDDDKVFTVEDLEKISEKHVYMVHEESKCEGNGWSKSSIDMQVWSKFPLGLLPFQSRIECSLPKELTWRRKPCAQKRSAIPLVKHSLNMKRIRASHES